RIAAPLPTHASSCVYLQRRRRRRGAQVLADGLCNQLRRQIADRADVSPALEVRAGRIGGIAFARVPAEIVGERERRRNVTAHVIFESSPCFLKYFEVE